MNIFIHADSILCDADESVFIADLEGGPLRWAGLTEEEVGGANDPEPLSAVPELDVVGGGTAADDEGTPGLVSTTTAVGA